MEQQIFAHRGASGSAPENTLEAFGMAAQVGAHGVELDVHICRSGELVVIHDETVDRVTDGTGHVCDLTLSELKALRVCRPKPEYPDARIPTLAEVFSLLRDTGLRINIELKNNLIDYPDLERRTIDLAAEMGMLDRVLFSSFNHASMQRVKAIDPGIPCGLLYAAAMVKPWVYAVALGMNALHPNYSQLVTVPDCCAAAHRAGIAVNPWTVNQERDIRAMLRAGADILITNYPELALRCLREA